ncbi:MAG: insulinase family protein, partial [Actinomycetia bacterium]|nr:insulinase family protein [Actinomycetes bacterium]
MAVPALTAARKARPLTALERVLDSGLRVLVVRKPGVPLAEVRLRVPFMSARPRHEARAPLLAESMLTGTKSQNRQELAAALQGLGASLGVGVNADRLLLSGSVLAANLPQLLTLVAEVLIDGHYSAREVAAERSRLIERLIIARSQSQVVAAEALAEMLYGTHPYARAPQVADVDAANSAQLRRLHRELARPDGASLVVVGDVSPARAADAIETALAGWTGAGAAGRVPALPAIGARPLGVVHRPGSVQSSIRLGGAAAPRDDPRYPALQLANLVFGGYFSSRWNENIREDKGYTYGPHSQIEHHALGSALVFDADVATEVTAPALLETRYELGRICLLPVTEAELASARQFAIGSLALSTATQAGLASTLSALDGAGLGRDWLAEHPRRLAAVSVDEVLAAAAEFFAPSRLVGVVVGDADAITEPLSRMLLVESRPWAVDGSLGADGPLGADGGLGVDGPLGAD